MQSSNPDGQSGQEKHQTENGARGADLTRCGAEHGEVQQTCHTCYRDGEKGPVPVLRSSGPRIPNNVAAKALLNCGDKRILAWCCIFGYFNFFHGHALPPIGCCCDQRLGKRGTGHKHICPLSALDPARDIEHVCRCRCRWRCRWRPVWVLLIIFLDHPWSCFYPFLLPRFLWQIVKLKCLLFEG